MMNMLANSAAPAQMRQSTMENVSKLFLDDAKVEMNVGAVMDQIDEELCDMSQEVRRKARSTIPNCASPGDAVKRLMHSRLKQILRDGVLTGNVNIVGAARLLAPRVQKMAAKLARICSINREVHSPIYNKLIRDATQAVLAQNAGGN
jgi:hypothetical protein